MPLTLPFVLGLGSGREPLFPLYPHYKILVSRSWFRVTTPGLYPLTHDSLDRTVPGPSTFTDPCPVSGSGTRGGTTQTSRPPKTVVSFAGGSTPSPSRGPGTASASSTATQEGAKTYSLRFRLPAPEPWTSILFPVPWCSLPVSRISSPCLDPLDLPTPSLGSPLPASISCVFPPRALGSPLPASIPWVFLLRFLGSLLPVSILWVFPPRFLRSPLPAPIL